MKNNFLDHFKDNLTEILFFRNLIFEINVLIKIKLKSTSFIVNNRNLDFVLHRTELCSIAFNMSSV